MTTCTETPPRPAPATFDDMLAVARTLWAVARSEPEVAQIAVAWVIRNRAEKAMIHRCATGRLHPEFGDGTLAGACRALDQFPCWSAGSPIRGRMLTVGFEDPRFCRAFAIANRVWNGDYTDPVKGATRFHRHTDSPDWATAATPEALIGVNFFYAGGDVPTQAVLSHQSAAHALQ